MTTWRKLLIICLMLVSVVGVSRAFSGPVVSTNEDLIPGRYQGIRVEEKLRKAEEMSCRKSGEAFFD